MQNTLKLLRSVIPMILSIGLVSLSNASAPAKSNSLYSKDTPAEIQDHHRLVPKDDMWWTITGAEMGWAHRNVQQLFPTVTVNRGGLVRELISKPMREIDNFIVDTPMGSSSFLSYLNSDQSTTMGIVILHKGKLVFETYPRMDKNDKPIYWSVTKVLPATIIRIMEERGEVNVNKTIEFYLPELKDSDFKGITVRNILDMATGLDCQDEYEDHQSCYYQYSITIGDGFRDKNLTLDQTLADNPYDFLKTLKTTKHAPQGQRFSYSGVNTFVLAWLIEKITGETFQQVLSREIWSHIGAEADALLLAYHLGIPVTHGGLLANIRDVARFGLLFTPSYSLVSDKKVISEQHLEFIANGGNPQLLINAGQTSEQLKGIKHNIYQWDRVYHNGYLFKDGWAGQGLLINPKHDLVVVYTGFYKDDYSQVPLMPILFDVLNSIFEVD